MRYKLDRNLSQFFPPDLFLSGQGETHWRTQNGG